MNGAFKKANTVEKVVMVSVTHLWGDVLRLGLNYVQVSVSSETL